MTAKTLNEDNAALLSQCLDFCQTLANKSLTFSFNFTLGDSFSFSVDTSEKKALAVKVKKKKKTPSTLRRNAKRREEFLKKKLETSTGSEHVSVEEAVSKQVEEALVKHTTPEKERDGDHIVDLVLSPVCGQRDDEDTMPLPLPTLSLVCDRPDKRSRRGPKCGKTFNSEHDLRCHGHKDHDYCFEHQNRYEVICHVPGGPRCKSQALAFGYFYHP